MNRFRNFWLGAAVLPLAIVLSACHADRPAAASSPAAATAPQTNSSAATSEMEVPRAEHGTPQPKLATLKLWVGTNEVTAEIAHTIPQIMTGMMWRTNMNEMEGMLFVFPRPQQVGFWMRNTLLPLSCAYINPEGTILEVHAMTPRDETPITAASDQVQYVLEMKQGWFDRHGVKPGVLIATDRGTLPQTFFRR